MTTERFQVPGISCQHCVNAITKEVSAVPGVQKVVRVFEVISEAELAAMQPRPTPAASAPGR